QRSRFCTVFSFGSTRQDPGNDAASAWTLPAQGAKTKSRVRARASLSARNKPKCERLTKEVSSNAKSGDSSRIACKQACSSVQRATTLNPCVGFKTLASPCKNTALGSPITTLAQRDGIFYSTARVQ